MSRPVDLVVVGSGAAGLSAALDAAAAGLQVLVVTKDAIDEGSTRWAQGGVAVVLGDEVSRREHDSIERHVQDTITAGAGLCDEDAVRSVITGGPAAVAALRARGARFDVEGDGALARTREGGHSAFRVVPAGGDATGAEVERTLVAALSSAPTPPVTVLTGHTAVEVLRVTDGPVTGVRALDEAGRSRVFAAPAVLLATGGLGQLYRSTTNPAPATGDGIALGLRAGAVAADLEFVQFHPTVLWDGPTVGRRALVTEAVRGEGAVLIDDAGRRFMLGQHPLAELAPRDVVAGAITRELDRSGAPCVWLDARALDGFAARFPTVFAACRAAGIDPRREPIPVTPAAHYACGGLVTDTSGRTGVPGLYAAGEVARTGLHGANRLASNSLLEAMVVGGRIAPAVLADGRAGRLADAATVATAAAAATTTGLAAPAGVPAFSAPAGLAAPTADRTVVQAAMSRWAAIGRTAAGLAAASDAIEAATVDLVPTDRAGVEDAALTLVARAVLAAAGTRRESRGCHVRLDFPDRDDERQGSSLLVALDESGAPQVRTAVGVR